MPLLNRKTITFGNKRKALIIGIMSGTSHDGVDTALVKINSDKEKTRSKEETIHVQIIGHQHIPYPKRLREEISCAFKGDTGHICRLNFKLGEVFGKAALLLLKKTGIDKNKVDAIASHGQTIYHIPPKNNNKKGSTLQIGEPSVIAEITGILTISDFRTRDMAAGGHGAPLVPLADYLLFGRKGRHRAILNIGGISNVTILRKRLEELIAFDIGPGNSLIDEAVKIYTNNKRSYDKDGAIARSGEINDHLLKELLSHPYLKLGYPKSTGREMFGVDMVRDIFNRYPNLSSADIIRTFTYFTAINIYNSLRQFRIDEIILTGGGVKNRFLIEIIGDLFKKRKIQISKISDYGIPIEAKEALSFAILGYQTLRLREGNIPHITGSRHGVILGKITLP